MDNIGKLSSDLIKIGTSKEYADKDKALDAVLSHGLEAMTKKDPSKGGNRKSKAVGSTFIVRFANHCGLEHPLITTYLSGNSGVNDTTQRKEILSLAAHLVNLLHSDKGTMTLSDSIALKLNDFMGTTPEDTTDELPSIGEDTLPALPSFDEGEEEAQAQEASDAIVFDTWNDFMAVAGNYGKAELQDAYKFINKVDKNGNIMLVTMSGKKSYKPNTEEWQMQTTLIHIAADALRISPKRNVTRTSHADKNGRPYKSIGWFTELCKVDDKQVTAQRKQAVMILGMALIDLSEKNYYSSRFARFVSDNFVEEAIEKLGIDTETRDSQVMGGSAKSWNWPYQAGGWKSTPSEAVDVWSLDITDL